MKIAFLLARTSAGWSLVESGDPAALRAEFKRIKVAGFADVGEQRAPADAVFYFDSAGNMRRKLLDEAEAVAGRERAKVAAQAAEQQAAAAAKAADEEGRARAAATVVAQKAVAVIAEAVVAAPAALESAAGEPDPLPAAQHPAPAAPVPASEPEPAASAAEGDETAAHFGGPGAAPKPKRR